MHIGGNANFLHGLADFNQLCRTGFGMGFQLAPLGPLVCLVMVIDIAKKQAIPCFVDDQPNIAARPNRPEILVPYIIDFVKTHTRIGRIDLEIKGCGFDYLLFVTGEFGEAVGEGICDSKLHQISYYFNSILYSRYREVLSSICQN